MSGFSADWLALREPADAAAREPALLEAAAAWAASKPAPHAVDLGCGTGSTFRALAPRLPGARWTLVDHDPALLEEAARRTVAATLRADLAQGAGEAMAGADLVTASALFDLCSARWIDAFVAALPPGAALYAALSYDGREEWSPAHPAEPRALAAFHAHQRGDKGFGPSLGPDAAAHLARTLEARGYDVRTARSDWRLGPDDRGLISMLADGAAEAVEQTGAIPAEILAAWRDSRRAARSVLVGHVDLLALPPG